DAGAASRGPRSPRRARRPPPKAPRPGGGQAGGAQLRPIGVGAAHPQGHRRPGPGSGGGGGGHRTAPGLPRVQRTASRTGAGPGPDAVLGPAPRSAPGIGSLHPRGAEGAAGAGGPAHLPPRGRPLRPRRHPGPAAFVVSSSMPVSPRPPDAQLLETLGQRLGLPELNPVFGLAALTHKSFVNEHRDEGADNERLEFLGDAVVDLVVSHRLMERFPEADEGELSKLRALLVNEDSLARVARQLGLGNLLRMGRGEGMTGGRDKSSGRADAPAAGPGGGYPTARAGGAPAGAGPA